MHPLRQYIDPLMAMFMHVLFWHHTAGVDGRTVDSDIAESDCTSDDVDVDVDGGGGVVVL